MVLPRVLTSALLVPFVLAVVWYGSIPFFLFVLGVSVLCAWEYSLIAQQGGYPNQIFLLIGGSALMVLALWVDGAPWGALRRAPAPFFVFCLISFLIFLREFFRKDQSYSFLRVITTLAGVALCGLFLGHLVLIRDLRLVAVDGLQPSGRKIMFFLILTIWALDTACWAVGRAIGKHPLAPAISPKKTWEGTIGGTLVTCLIAFLMREIFLKAEFGRKESVVFALAIAFTAQISDLIESLMKRSFGVKDSSQLLPGHGGFLDRFDSFLFAAPFFYYLLIATGRFR